MSDRMSLSSGWCTRSSVRSRDTKAEAAARIAELQVKLNYVDVEAAKRDELEKVEADKRTALERIETERELAMAQIRLQVLENYDDTHDSVNRQDDEPDRTVAYGASPDLPVGQRKENVEKYLRSLPRKRDIDEQLGDLATPRTPHRHDRDNDMATPCGDKQMRNDVNRNEQFRGDVDVPNRNGQFRGDVDVPYRNEHFTEQLRHDTASQHREFRSDMTRSTKDEQLREDLIDLTKTLANHVSQNRLPIPEPGIFNGDPLQFTSWRAAFETLIEGKNIPPADRLYYLKRYLGGAAKEALEGYFQMTTEEAYSDAKNVLIERYGNPFIVANAFREKLSSWPKIRYRDGLAMRKYGDVLRQCLTAMDTVDNLKVLNYERENKELASKLPDSVMYSWNRTVVQKKAKGEFPKFKEFVNFVSQEAKVACETIIGATGTQPQINKHDNSKPTWPSRKPPPEVRNLSTGAKKVFVCLCCDGNHETDNCERLKSYPLEKKKYFVIERGLCFACLKWGHMSKLCPARKTCNICKRKHPTVFHYEQKEERKNERAVNGRIKTSDKDGGKCSMIVPVWLSHENNPDDERLVYALLDTQSDTTFVLQDTCEAMNLKGTEVQLSLSTMYQENTVVQTEKIKGLYVKAFRGGDKIPLPCTYTRNIMPVNREHIPTPENIANLPYLENISKELVPLMDCEVGLLIGYNCPQALTPRDVIPADGNSPYAIRTDLGWSVVGVINDDTEDDAFGTSHRILTYTVPQELSDDKKITVSLCTTVKETILPSEVKKLLEADFVETKETQSMSHEDRQFLKIADKGICQTSDKHYEMPLPFRKPDPELPNNREQAMKRLQGLVRRFRSDNKFHEDYKKFMNNMIANGHAERAPTKHDTVWYIPHHGVYNPKKPNKIRVVFDCSAEYRGYSLNNQLLQGPDLTNSLVGVLCRFRQERVAFSCDVEQMFYQFRVSENHRDFLRFLWFEDGDYTTQPVEYRMKVHLFGATSSPGCANFAFHRCADDYGSEVSDAAADFVRQDFYVDDGLKSVSTVEEGVNLIKDSVELCSKAGIRLHKFISNSKEVLAELPPEDCAQVVTANLSLPDGLHPIERPLGIQWCLESDTLSVRVTLNDGKLTRRAILSTVSSVYDPLGFIAPVVMVGKSILQEMCRDKLDWDDPLPEHLRPRWEKWRTEIVELTELHVDRCYRPAEFGDLKTVEMHHFSDASNLGYGQCSYLRLIDDSDRVHVSFLMGKSRVAPLKQVTIPRLELTAALVSVRISDLLCRELEYDQIKEVFWTDSKVVIGYINNDSKRFHVFVANRVSQIREKTEPEQWKYIESKRNPADDASRGLTARELMNKSDWLTGPSFLWDLVVPETTRETNGIDVSQGDPEVKKVRTLATIRNLKPLEPERFEHCSSWYRLKRAVAMCLKLKSKLRYIVLKKQMKDDDKATPENPGKCTDLNVSDIEEAELEIVRLIQQSAFPESVKILKTVRDCENPDQNFEKTLKKSSELVSLDPFMDKKGIVRVGGRIRNSSLTCNVKHPVVLPKGSHVSKLVIRYFHEKTHHQGRGMTVNEIRSNGFWIIGCVSAVSSYIYKCVLCRKLRHQTQQQKMSDLPSERVNESPPFTYCGVDCFGPFLVKEGRKMLKRYGVLFTCLASRAIHIETASSLSTDSFINALRRFQAVRGPIRELRCDRGTNFVGARNEFREAYEKLNHDKVRTQLLKENCDFVYFRMNVPNASHMGGAWERQIRTVRSVLNALMKQASQQLDDEGLRTLMSEATAIVNSRPLSVQNLNDPVSFEPLTANHLLTMKSRLILPPPGQFQKADVYLCKQWRRVQYFANEFWTRWKKEVLHDLQMRQKWVRAKRSVQIGDIVIVSNDNLPRSLWQIGKVVETFPSDDGHVRKVKLKVGDNSLDSKGRRVHAETFLERPIHKLVLLLEAESK